MQFDKINLIERRGGFNLLEWMWIGLMLFVNCMSAYVLTYVGSMTLGVALLVTLMFTAITGVLPVFLLRGAVGAFRKLRRHIASR